MNKVKEDIIRQLHSLNKLDSKIVKAFKAEEYCAENGITYNIIDEDNSIDKLWEEKYQYEDYSRNPKSILTQFANDLCTFTKNPINKINNSMNLSDIISTLNYIPNHEGVGPNGESSYDVVSKLEELRRLGYELILVEYPKDNNSVTKLIKDDS